jgi:4-diphosphocytidyl-2-C-methyl-D-erythritol kinase
LSSTPLDKGVGGSRLKAVRVECNAKINLYLKILGPRDDGYHNIETVYHSISLHDTLTLTPRASGLSIECDEPAVPVDDSNIALKAAERILESTSHGLHIGIKKRIPVGAGLAGGSADAAGVLLGANALYGLNRPPSDLDRMAEGLGADVKFILHGGCATGHDRGDRLVPHPALPPVPVLLVVPPITISTTWAYDSHKMVLTRDKSRLTMISSALAKGDVTYLCDLLENDFEGLIFDRFPLVRDIKESLLGCGACGALMTGSGPVVFGMFREEGDAQACRGRFLEKGLIAVLTSLAAGGVTVSR